MRLGEVSITPGLKTSLKVLEISILGGNHPTEFIMLLLNRVTKDEFLKLDIYCMGGLVLLMELKEAWITTRS